MTSSPQQKTARVDEYIAFFPEDTQARLREIRELITHVAPAAIESISYAIPTYKVNNKVLIYFAGYEKHVALYPLPHDMDIELALAIKPHVTGKGTLRFSLSTPLPAELIKKVVTHRLNTI